jgi:hypothetical protein
MIGSVLNAQESTLPQMAAGVYIYIKEKSGFQSF